MSLTSPRLPAKSPGAALLPILLIADIPTLPSRRTAAPHGSRDVICGSPRLCRSPASSSCGSMSSNREKHTPEADSSPDGSPMPTTSTKFAKLRIESSSPPTPEPHLQKSTSSLKRPATDEPFDRECNGSESPRKDAAHCNINQHSPSYPSPSHYKYQKHEAFRKDHGSPNSCTEMRPYPDCRRPS